MKVIGITGGIGSGKSKVLDFLEEHYQAHIYKADEIAHQLQEPGNKGYEEIVVCFGKDILKKDHTIDRDKLGTLVFSCPQELQKLNKIIHPLVKKTILKMIEIEEKKHTSLVVIEAALLLEENYDKFCDEIWYIYAKEDIRMERLRKNRNYSEEKIRNVMKRQFSEEIFREKSHVIIDNNDDFKKTCEQIQEVLG